MKNLNFLSTSPTGGRIISVSYRFRIGLVSIPYQSRINPVSSSYRSPIVLASRSGNNTETIRKRYVTDPWRKGGRSEDDIWWKRGGRMPKIEAAVSTWS